MQDVGQRAEARSEAPPPGANETARRRRRRQARALKVVGLLFILSALGVGGYVGWLLWGTGLTTRAAQADLRDEFELKIATREPDEAPLIQEPSPTPAEEPEAPRVAQVPGEAVAILRIPQIDLNYVVVEGTDAESLKKGPGHYGSTAYPWEESGRVGIAGHRTTYGAPFWSLNELRPGHRITLATEYGIFNYRVTGSRIVLPSQSSVLSQTNKPTLVLTTCNPRFSAAQRLIVFAERVD